MTRVRKKGDKQKFKLSSNEFKRYKDYYLEPKAILLAMIEI